MSLYDLARGLHILAVIAWMAGMLYLPRLYVYHSRAAAGSDMDATFQMMEAKLLKIIINPAMVAAWVLGGWLIWIRSGQGQDFSFLHQPWMATKLVAVVALSGWHGFLAGARKKFAAGANVRSERFWRMTNEIPFLLAIVIVLSATLEWGV